MADLKTSIIMIISCLGLCYTVSMPSKKYCAHIPPGKYCFEDLSGYHDCNTKEHDMVKCPSETRCSCLSRKRCHSPNICQKFLKPKFLDTFSVYFQGYKNVTWRQGVVRSEQIYGMMGQDTQKESKTSYLFKGFDNLKVEFNGIVKENGTLVKYDETCKREIIKTFPSFDEELKKFSLIETKITKNKTFQQKWYFEVGSRHFDDSRTKTTWVTELLMDEQSRTELLRPVSFLKEFQGGQNQAYDETTFWKVVSFEPTDKALRTSICKSLN